jgi:hypothetical protein
VKKGVHMEKKRERNTEWGESLYSLEKVRGDKVERGEGEGEKELISLSSGWGFLSELQN